MEQARNYVENRTIRESEAVDWMERTGWDVSAGENGSAALRNPNTRDATVFGMIQNFYNRDHDATAILEAFNAQGFNNGTTTNTYLINMGPDSLARSNSNHEATLVVDESANPPIITLNFRGSNSTGVPAAWREGLEGENIFMRLFDMATNYIFGRMGDSAIPEWLTHFKAASDYLGNGRIDAYQQQADAFWEDAGPEINRIIAEVQARHPGVDPQIILSGHSYGADAATRMVHKIGIDNPSLTGQISLLGFGGISSFTGREQTEIMALLGNDENRAIQYINNNDYLDRVARLDPWNNNVVGTRRVIEGIGPDGHQYELPARAMAMMEVVEDAIDDNPRTAMQNARAIVDAYQADPDNFLSRLSEYTSAGRSGSDLLSVLIPSRASGAALAA